MTDRSRSRDRSPAAAEPAVPAEKQTDNTKVYIAGVSYDIDKAALTALVDPHVRGPIDVRFVFEPAAQRHRGFAFVNCDSVEDAQAVIDAMNGKEIKGRTMTATFAKVPIHARDRQKPTRREREVYGERPRDRSLSPVRGRVSPPRSRDYDRQRVRPERSDRYERERDRPYGARDHHDRYDYPPRRYDDRYRYDDRDRYDRNDRDYDRPRSYAPPRGGRDPRDYDPRSPPYDADRHSPEPRYRGRERGPRSAAYESPPRSARTAYGSPARGAPPRSAQPFPSDYRSPSRSRSPSPRAPAAAAARSSFPTDA